MTRAKICGLTRLDDARQAQSHGADYLGFIFHPASPRAISAEKAREIVQGLPESRGCVGVFVNAPVDEIERTLRVAGITIAQLHGDEVPGQLAVLRARGFRTIKALRPRAPGELERLRDFEGANLPSEGFLIDAATEGGRYGGTGCTADWELARRAVESKHRVFLAGGLSPENVAKAIREVQPFAVDASSALEERPGLKSADLVRRFLEQVRGADEGSR